jgi:hypothetical protein
LTETTSVEVGHQHHRITVTVRPQPLETCFGSVDVNTLCFNTDGPLTQTSIRLSCPAVDRNLARVRNLVCGLSLSVPQLSTHLALHIMDSGILIKQHLALLFSKLLTPVLLETFLHARDRMIEASTPSVGAYIRLQPSFPPYYDIMSLSAFVGEGYILLRARKARDEGFGKQFGVDYKRAFGEPTLSTPSPNADRSVLSSCLCSHNMLQSIRT